MTAILTATDLCVHYGDLAAVQQCNLAVPAGSSIGLVGESGCGKSTLLMALAGLLPPSAQMTGSVSWDGQVIQDFASLRGTRIGIIFQDPSTALTPWLSIEEQLTEGPRALLQLSKATAKQRAIDLLTAVGIKQPAQALRRYPHQFSGGQRQRIVIAIALACDPQVLLCDEPTTALDVTIQAQILALLDNLRRQRQCSLVFVSHDLAVIGAVCETIHVMYGGRIIESGSSDTIKHNPRHPYTKALQAASPDIAVNSQFPLPTVTAEDIAAARRGPLKASDDD